MTIERRDALICLAGSATALLGCPSVLSAQSVRRQAVALLVPLTGPSAAIGLSMQRATTLVQTDALTLVDSGDTPATAALAARNAIRKGARLLIGPLFGAQVRAVVAVAGRVPVISFTNDESLLNSGALLLGITASQIATTVLTYARSRGIRSVGVLTGADDWSRQIAAAAQTAGGDLGLGISGLNQPATVTTDALFVPGGDPATIALARRLRGSGTQLLGTSALLAANAPDAIAGAWIAAPEPAAYDSFLKGYETRHGGNAGLIAALAYDGAVIARDARAAGPITRDALLANPGFAGATGRFRFRSDGSCVRQLAILVATPGGYDVAESAPPA